MIIYIHGFASSGMGIKAQIIRDHFKKESIAPSLSYIPDLAIDTVNYPTIKGRASSELQPTPDI